MTIAEVAKLIDKSEQSVRRAIRSGKLTAIKVKGQYVINEKDIPDSLMTNATIDTGVSHTDSHAIVKENELLKQRIGELEATIKEKDTILEDNRQRQDTIILQLTRQVEQTQKMLEEHKPFWKRLFRKQKE